MPTLNKTTHYTRYILKWGALIAASIFLLVMLFRIGTGIKEYFFPTPPPPPTVSFGKLPQIGFPEPPINEKFSYKLETVSGNFPFFSDRANVYQIIPPSINLLNPDRTKEKAAAIGFVDNQNIVLPEQKIDSTTYHWQEEGGLQRQLTMDINSFNFTLTSNYLTDDVVKNSVNLPSEANAIKLAANYLEKMGLYATDMDDVKTKTTLLTIKDSSISIATSFSTTQLIRVDFFQKSISDLPVVYPYPPYSLMSLLVAGGEIQGQIVEAKFIHRDVTSSSATYPIKTAAQAYEELKNGKAYIASFNGSGKNVTIRSITLGYFVHDGQQDFLQPVIIFEGDDNFIAYISAIHEDWIISPTKDVKK